MGEAGRRDATEKFCAGKIVPLYEALYARLTA
jgi:hypothetical protein